MLQQIIILPQVPSNSRKGIVPYQEGKPKLDAPLIDGYTLRWFRGDPGRIQRAQQAGWEFVDKDDTDIVDTDLAGGDAKDKGTDLGSRVSIVSGDDIGFNGQPGRMYLMKCALHIYKHARSLHGEQVDATVNALKGATPGNVREGGETKEDSRTRYVKELKAPLLTKKST